MSRIFEALRKTEGDLADLALPMVNSEGSAADERTAATATAAPPEVEEREEFAAPDSPVARANGLRTLPVRIRSDAPILPFQSGHSRVGEQYRIARTKIIQHPDQPRTIVVSSAGPGDGKTVSAINLAGALALKNDSQVMLIEADMRRPNIASLLGLPAQPGLSEYLAGQYDLEDVIVQVEQFPNLSFVPAGRADANPTELLDSQRWRTACEEFRRRSRFVIFDAPPVGTVADYDLIEANCDGVVFVVRPDLTNRKMCLERLTSIPKGKLIGVLMNCVPDWFLWKARDRYYYAES